MRKRARSPSISDDDDAPTDTEAPTVDKSTDSRAASESPTADKSPGSCAASEASIEPVANTVSASSSLDILDSDDEKTKAKKKSKRRRTMDRRTSSLAGTDKLAALLKEESTRRAAHNARMATTFETFVEDAREQKKEVTSLLRDLVNIAEKEL
jgi:cytochrome P450